MYCDQIRQKIWLKKASTVSKHYENSWNVGLVTMNIIYRSLKELNQTKDILIITWLGKIFINCKIFKKLIFIT